VNKAQRIVLKLFGSAGEEIERESRAWVVVCPECGDEVSYWELGGIRAGAASAGKKMRRRCERCQTFAWNDVVHRPELEEPLPPREPGEPPAG
jgi:hypothetical protein